MASCISWHYSWVHWADVQSFLLLQRMFWIVCCIPFQVVMSTETCCLFCSRFSHLPWLKHNSVTDAALAMRMTEQILCFLFILISLLQVSIPWTVIAERPKIKFDLWQVKAALEMSVTGVLAGMLFVNCVISVCVLSISHITASLSFPFHLAYTGSLRSGLLLVPFRRS